ncbi:MAG: Chitinase family protein [Herbinix sp.]|jgi:spore germination protein YaaH|nr:Chitinase family protein [Herbinix sp.]
MRKNSTRFFLVLTLILSIVFNSSIAVAKPATKPNSPPAAPSSLSYSSLTSSEVTLTWSSVYKATGYKVYRATNYDTGHTLIATVTTNSYRNISLAAGTKYWYYVKAYNSYGDSAASNHISIITNQSTPTVTPVPTSTPTPTSTPAPTATPVPTATPTPAPTATPLPTSTPIPTATPFPTTTPVPTATPIPSSGKVVMGFATYYYSGDSSSYNSIVANTSMLDTIATHTFITDGSGNISGLVPSNQITYANNNGIQTLAMFSNNFDGAIAHTLLTNPTNRQALIYNIVSAIKQYGYQGVNIDMEGVYYYDRSYLTTFMNELYQTLHPQGYYVTVAVPAKTSDSPTASWSGAYDYPALAAYADQVVLMTYDEHYPGGSPGAIASIGWVENVIRYASSIIPKEKLLVGTAAYGYDWSINGTKAYGISAIYNLANTYGALIQWDSIAKSPYFTYVDASGILHTVWFENAQSLSYKLDLINSYHLGGIAIWRLGLENADYWNTIKAKFN